MYCLPPSHALENPHDPLSRVDGELGRQTKDAGILDEAVIHRREVDQADFAVLSEVAVLDVPDDGLEDDLVEREEEIEPIVVVELLLDVARVVVDQRDPVLEAELSDVLLRDVIRLLFVLDAADMVEAVVEEREERTAFAAAEVEDVVPPPPVDKRGICPAWGKSLSVC